MRSIQVNHEQPALALGVYLDGSDAPDIATDGRPLVDDDFLVLVNAWWERLEFVVPDGRPRLAWRAEIDTFDPAAGRSHPEVGAPSHGDADGCFNGLISTTSRNSVRITVI